MTEGATSNVQSHLDPTPTSTEKTPSRQPSSRTLNAQQRRSLITKFNTIHTDKYPENLRREFPKNNFDCKVTVEKAKFDSQPLNHDTNNTPSHHHHHHKDGYSIATPATTASCSPPHDHLQASSSHHRSTAASSPTSYTTNNSITPSASSTTGLVTTPSTYSVNGNGTGVTTTPTVPCTSGNTTAGGGGNNGSVKPIMQPTKSRSEVCIHHSLVPFTHTLPLVHEPRIPYGPIPHVTIPFYSFRI